MTNDPLGKQLLALNKKRQRLAVEYQKTMAKLQDGAEGDPPDAFYEEIGRRIRTARKEADFTQEVVSLFAGLTRASIANIEKGVQHVQLKTLVRFAELFSCDYRDFLPDARPKKRRGKKR